MADGTGRVGNLTKDQTVKLQKFKESVKDVLQEKHTDHHLLRFLRARNFNLKKAEDMFRNDLEWRRTKDVSTINSYYKLPEAVEKYWVGGEVGADRDGNVVLVIPLGNADPRGLIKCMKSSEHELIRILIMQDLYRMQKENSRRQGRYIEGLTVICDMDGLGPHFLWRPAVSFFTELLQSFEAHYPETVKRVFVIRAPAIFPVAYSLVKPFLHVNTRNKIRILSGKWEKTVHQYIDPEVLPQHWGGTRTDENSNPRMPNIVLPGGKIPEGYYVTDNVFDENALTKTIIGKGSHKDLHYSIITPGCAIRYIFKTNEGEIIFSISYCERTGESDSVLQEPKKFTCHITPADGEIICSNSGKYTLVFENPSRLKSKTLSYQVEVIEPDLEENDENAD